jgi:hypothetical protein
MASGVCWIAVCVHALTSTLCLCAALVQVWQMAENIYSDESKDNGEP